MKGKPDKFRKRMIIDADNNKVLEFFKIEETEEKLNYYKSLNKWNDISVDRSGDIILWEE
jgi:hypothetical protein